jgi:hypothetical protein
MTSFLKIAALTGLLVGSLTAQSYAFRPSDYPKTRTEAAFAKSAKGFHADGRTGNAASSDTGNTSSYPLTRQEKRAQKAHAYTAKFGAETGPAPTLNRYTDVTEYPLPHTTLKAERGGYVYARNQEVNDCEQEAAPRRVTLGVGAASCVGHHVETAKPKTTASFIKLFAQFRINEQDIFVPFGLMVK